MRLRALLLLAVAANVVAALAPFRLDLPRRAANRIERNAGGSWQFHDPSLALTASAPSWLDDAKRSAQLHVDLRVLPASGSQTGPARILTISEDLVARNLMIGQEGDDLIVRFRRPGSDLNGMPAFVVRDVLDADRWRDLSVDVDPGNVDVRVDGVTRVHRRLPPDALAGWDSSFRLALGNEVIGQRPWVGRIDAAVITTPQGRDDLLAPGRLEVPDGWWQVPDRLRAVTTFEMPVDALIALLHLLAFAPVGYLLARDRAPDPVRHITALAVQIGALSLGIEVLKVVVAGRHPSVLNLAAQIAGGLIGLALAIRRVRGRR